MSSTDPQSANEDSGPHGADRSSDDENRHRRRPTWWEGLAVIISVVSAAAAIVTVKLSRDVDVSVGSGTPYEGAQLFNDGTVLLVTALNDSSRTANLTGAEVTFNGKYLGTVNYAVPSVNDLSPTERRDLVAAALPLPVSLPAGRAVIMALVVDDVDLDGASRVADAAANGKPRRVPRDGPAFSACHHDPALFPAPPPAASSRAASASSRSDKDAGRLTVTMTFEPGDTKTAEIPVRPALEGQIYTSAIRNADLSAGWTAYLDVDDAHVQGLAIVKPGDDPPETVEIKLWREPEHQARMTATGPALGITCVPFGRLSTGRYRWSASANGHTVAVGSFRTPCRPKHKPKLRQSVHLEDCRPTH